MFEIGIVDLIQNIVILLFFFLLFLINLLISICKFARDVPNDNIRSNSKNTGVFLN